ncbi:hypothetical protein [uncultured Jatrophihabitans sp.]|uniref:hypothetical protein n=1 Tax=uncultured Jatrophihabitans sp. TaxID=1610747 RepID=UPI0035CC27FB
MNHDDQRTDELLRAWGNAARAMPEASLPLPVDLPNRHRARWVAIAGVVAAVIAGAVVLSLLTKNDTSNPATLRTRPPVSVVTSPTPSSIAGLEKLGPVTWSNPVADASNPRLVYIEAITSEPPNACGIETIHPQVTAKTGRIHILLTDYGHRVPKGAGCPLVARKYAFEVRLPSPLGQHPLYDATDGKPHEVYDPASSPYFGKTPPGCSVQPLQWSPKLKTATLECYNTHNPTDASAELYYAPVGGYSAIYGPLNGKLQPTTTIQGKRAKVWRYQDAANDIWYLRWTIATGREVTLTVRSNPTHDLQREQVVAIAHAVKPPTK